MDARASPRKPRVLISSRSSIFWSLEVACLSHSKGKSSFCSKLGFHLPAQEQGCTLGSIQAHMNSMSVVCDLQQLSASFLDHHADLSSSCSTHERRELLGLFAE